MMGTTHGLAGLNIGAGIVLGCHALGAPLGDAQSAAVVIGAAVASELPDLDLRQSRISHGTSSLTAVPYLGVVGALITLPVALVGIAIRATHPDHRGATHSFTAQALWAAAIAPLYAAYWWLLAHLTQWASRHWRVVSTLRLDDAAAAAAHAWPVAAPWCALAVLLGALSHLLLDDLTAAPQALMWPLRRARVSVFRRPNFPVGGAREALLVALPLALVLAVVIWHAVPPTLHAPEVPGQIRHLLAVGEHARRATQRSR